MLICFPDSRCDGCRRLSQGSSALYDIVLSKWCSNLQNEHHAELNEVLPISCRLPQWGGKGDVLPLKWESTGLLHPFVFQQCLQPFLLRLHAVILALDQYQPKQGLFEASYYS